MASYFDLLEVAKSCDLEGSAITDFISQQQDRQRKGSEAQTEKIRAVKEASIATKETVEVEKEKLFAAKEAANAEKERLIAAKIVAEAEEKRL